MVKTDPVLKDFVTIQLTGGISKKQDSHQLSNGQLLTADNVVFGAIEGQVTKRYGNVSLNPQGAPLQGGPFKAIGMRDSLEPLILGANTLNRYNVERNLSTSLPTPTQGRLNVQQVAGSTGQTVFPWPPSDASCASDGNQYLAVTWQEPNALGALCFYGVQDLASGSWIITPRVLPNLTPKIGTINFNTMFTPSVKYANGNFYFFYLWSGVSGTNPVNYSLFVGSNLLPITNLANGMVASTNAYQLTAANSQLVTLSPSDYGYDVHLANGRYIIAFGPWDLDKSTFSYSAGTVAANGTLTQTQSGTVTQPGSITSISRCSVRCDGPAANPFLIGMQTSVAVIPVGASARVYTVSPGISTSVTLPIDCMWLADGTILVAQYNIGIRKTELIVSNITTTGTLITRYQTTAPVDTQYQQLLSRMFMTSDTTKVYFWAGIAGPSSDSVYNSAFLYEIDLVAKRSSVICRTLYLRSVHVTNSDMTFPVDVVQVANTGKYVTFLTATTEKTANSFRSFGTLNRVQFDFMPVRSPQLISLPQGGVLIAGAYPSYYDGAAIVEAGFSSTPTADQMTQTIISGNSGNGVVVTPADSGIPGGTSAVTPSGFIEYYYVICFVRRDAYGNVYRSAPSPVITAVCPDPFNEINFPGYVSNGGGNVMIEFYRSTQNVTGTYYFITQVGNGKSYTDRIRDGVTTPNANTSITKNRTVYTNANELPNDPPPAIHHAAVSEQRVYLIPADARNTIWFSKQFRPGRTVEFSANNVLSEGGNNNSLFTAIHVLDSYVIVFKADQVLYFYGTGPDNAGNGTFSEFQQITTDVGCIDPASIVTIPGGILFRSRRGIEMLNRSLQVSYIGGPVEPLLRTMGTITAAVVVPRFCQVRFMSSKPGSPVLVFDYGAGRWSTFSDMAAISAAMIDGTYYWISADGTKVYRETPDLYTDDGKPIVMTLETPEIPVGAGGIQGWGRAYRMALLGDFYTAHKLNVSFAYDHQTTYTDSVVFDTATGLITGDAVYQFRCSRLPRQVMQTLRIKITESGTIGQSCAISTLALEVGSKNGLAKLTAQKTV